MLNYIINLFIKPYFELTLLDGLVITLIFFILFLLIFGIYKLIKFLIDK